MPLSQASAARLQAALTKVGEFPGVLTLRWDDKTVRAVEGYWTSKVIKLPCRPSPADVQQALLPLKHETDEGTPVGIRLDYDELLDIGATYVDWKKEKGEYAGWFSCYWPWVVGSGVAVAAGGYVVYRATRKR